MSQTASPEQTRLSDQQLDARQSTQARSLRKKVGIRTCLAFAASILGTLGTTCTGTSQDAATKTESKPRDGSRALGACCLPNGVCEMATAAECFAWGGAYEGDGTTCDPSPCLDVIATPHIAGDFQGWNPTTDPMTETAPGSGIWQRSYSGLAPGSRHEFKITNGLDWADPNHVNHPLFNSWLFCDQNGGVVITYDSNVHAGAWWPMLERLPLPSDSAPGTWTAAGDFQGWDPADPATAMAPLGPGVYAYEGTGLNPGTHHWKAVVTGSWDSISWDGRSVNALDMPFDIESPADVFLLYVNARDGTVHAEVGRRGKTFAVEDVDVVARLTGAESMNQTDSVGIGGTDLGHMVNHAGMTYFLFGDTFSGANPGEGGCWRWNVMAYSTDDEPSDGLSFDGWILGDDVCGQPHWARQVIDTEQPDPPRITEIPTGAVSLNDRVYAWFMPVDWWGPAGEWTVNYGGLAYWEEGDPAFTIVPGFESPSNGNFGMVAASLRTDISPAEDSHLYVWGTPAGRLGGVKLARVLPELVEDHGAYEYFGGLDAGGEPTWLADESAAPLIVPPAVGEMSVMYNEAVCAWTILYFNHGTNAVELRESEEPLGAVVVAANSDHGRGDFRRLVCAVHEPALRGVCRAYGIFYHVAVGPVRRLSDAGVATARDSSG